MNNTSNRLAVLGGDIASQIALAKQHDRAGHDARYQICILLAEAREHFKDDQTFHAWLASAGVTMNKTDRANAITMGREPAKLKAALKAATSTSIQLIYKHNFRVHTDMKPAKSPSKAQAKAIHVLERMVEAGEVPKRDAISEEAGVSHGTADAVLAAHRAKTAPEPEEITLSDSAQKRFDAKWRVHMKTFNYEVETKVISEIKKRLGELYIPEYMKLLREVKQMLTWRRGVMTRKEYNVVIRCLHPDTGGHASDAARNEAFRLFTAHEAKLVDDEQEARLKRVSTLPQTVEEMMARRRTKGARA